MEQTTRNTGAAPTNNLNSSFSVMNKGIADKWDNLKAKKGIMSSRQQMSSTQNLSQTMNAGAQ